MHGASGDSQQPDIGSVEVLFTTDSTGGQLICKVETYAEVLPSVRRIGRYIVPCLSLPKMYGHMEGTDIVVERVNQLDLPN